MALRRRYGTSSQGDLIPCESCARLLYFDARSNQAGTPKPESSKRKKKSEAADTESGAEHEADAVDMDEVLADTLAEHLTRITAITMRPLRRVIWKEVAIPDRLGGNGRNGWRAIYGRRIFFENLPSLR